MPSAHPDLWAEVRAFLPEIDGDEGSDHACLHYLRDAGYTLNRDWTWSKPGVTDVGQMTRQEFACLLFLVHEWDFGALAAAKEVKA
jgi:hypothetical protein